MPIICYTRWSANWTVELDDILTLYVYDMQSKPSRDPRLTRGQRTLETAVRKRKLHDDLQLVPALFAA